MDKDAIMEKSNQFQNGIVVYSVTSYTAVGFPVSMNIIEKPWHDSQLKGEIGYIGKFKESITPVWR